MGIIDYLQEYNTKKKLELKLKSLFVSSDEARTLSVSDPDYYQHRFKKFMYEKVFSKHVGGVQMEYEFIEQLKNDLSLRESKEFLNLKNINDSNIDQSLQSQSIVRK